MRVTREWADALRIASASAGNPTIHDLATSYLAALNVVEAFMKQRDAVAARERIPLVKGIERQAAAERCFQADAALDVALEKWREG